MKSLISKSLVALGLASLTGCGLGFDRSAVLHAFQNGVREDSSPKETQERERPDRPERPHYPDSPKKGEWPDHPKNVKTPPDFDFPGQHRPKPDFPKPRRGYPVEPPDDDRDHRGGRHHDDDRDHRGGRDYDDWDHRRSRDDCHSSDSNQLCIGVNYVAYHDLRQGDEEAEVPRQVLRQLDEVNQIWKSCGIRFQLDRYRPVEPEAFRLNFRTADFHEFEEIRQRFATDSSFLVVVTGAWDRSGVLGGSWANAWTSLPGNGSYGAILEQPVGKDPTLLAHELGHYLSLGHVEDPSELMNPVILPTSVRLTEEQCEAARWAASYFWKKMLR